VIGRHAFYRTAVLALGVSAPSLILLASLAARGLLAVGAGLIAGTATVVVTDCVELSEPVKFDPPPPVAPPTTYGRNASGVPAWSEFL